MGAAGWGAVAQVGTDIANSALGAKFAQSQARKAHKRMVDAYQHRYRWTMADMKAAGLNPILAGSLGAGQGPGAPATQHPGNLSSGNYAQSALQAAMFKSQKEQVDAQAWEARQRGVQATTQSAKNIAESKLVNETRPHIVNQEKNRATSSAYDAYLSDADKRYHEKSGGWARFLERAARTLSGSGGRSQ